ncbi:DUF1570 domain-containing protein [Mangrovimicrobium sediminis]|uniref:DUF1570 domain-containing protein n=1 Tax=Mangrovimicrobium sediminis TaxID=2562682 RepID=A0A4Z0LZ58_9GAMM|nr:DUF1570 domain-containing protein [Haliea sp. SAOS-164]TGD72559.1 DUF1570 domain-containing protein [Haliea sp. SAOS-164]
MNSPRSWLALALLCAIGLAGALALRPGTGGPAAPVAAPPVSADGAAAADPQEARIPRGPVPPLRSAVNRPGEHGALEPMFCTRPASGRRQTPTSPPVYRWVDDQGQTHLSETPPRSYIPTVLDATGAERDFSYEILSEDTLPAQFETHLRTGAKRIYDTWHFFLGEQRLQQAHIRLQVIGDAARYAAVQAQVWPDSQPTIGFYSPLRNTAYVSFDAQRPGEAMRTAYHEISHLVSANLLGPTPPWLNEGLAEYFETMRVRGEGARFVLDRAHLQLLRRNGVPALDDLLTKDRQAWHTQRRARNYAAAWSLVHFLMQDNAGRYALKELIEQIHANFCRPFSARLALYSAYPGGTARLESEWRSWLRSQSAQ